MLREGSGLLAGLTTSKCSRSPFASLSRVNGDSDGGDDAPVYRRCFGWKLFLL